MNAHSAPEQQSGRPVVVVLDDEFRPSGAVGISRRTLLESLVGSFCDLRGAHVFTESSIGRGELALHISAKDVARLNPSALIADLDLVPGTSASLFAGYRLIQSILQSEELREVPLFVASNHASAYESRLRHAGVPAERIFVWARLEDDTDTQQHFSELLRRVVANTGKLP